ncbi:hypothetical protein QBC34DRAFT_417327 [Podospora aff. communis PSN243]|uniref:Uncharacterized protein n=1 Tax=Podospora aff. communis PSN243 TaxID=3040156 RepID=A0AAV9G7R4_9PEZI|nr:hypothetical protein QBC34DRAFT_417327 [Podospora aff. communis PSN243]
MPRDAKAETPARKEVPNPVSQPTEAEIPAPSHDQPMVDAPSPEAVVEAPSHRHPLEGPTPNRAMEDLRSHQPFVLPSHNRDQLMTDAPQVAPMPAAPMVPSQTVETPMAHTPMASTPMTLAAMAPAPMASAPMLAAPIPTLSTNAAPVPAAPMPAASRPADLTPAVPAPVPPMPAGPATADSTSAAPVPVAPVPADPTPAAPAPEAPMHTAPMSSESHVQPISKPAELDAPTNEETQPSPSALSSELSTPLSEPPLQFDGDFEPESFHSRNQHQDTPSGEPPKNAQTWIDIVEGSGDPVDHLRRIELDNHWAHEVLNLPVRRPLRLRHGKSLNPDLKEAIYRPTDAKGARWLACEIQATGEEQADPCQKCVKGTGPFQECVALGTTHLPRCGNCEWNKQSCSLSNKTPDDTSNRATPQATGFTAVNTPKPRVEPEDAASASSGLGDSREPSLAKSAAGKSLPSSQTGTQPKLETPMVGTPMSGSPAPVVVLGSGEEENLPEVNKSVLVLRDDGVVFTEPPCMAGVPLAKIGPDHPYWEPEWQNLEEVVEPMLKKWKEKYEYHMANNSSQSSKFLANRQINRGKAILKFLAEGELHPYQIFGKEHVNRQLANYDTLYRMVQILEELAKFNIDVTPSQWLRQRLYEIYMELGDEFNLSKTVQDLYHDPKVMSLRTKSGFGNIGRPSGRGSRQKRKELHITPKGTPTKTTATPTKEATTPSKLAATPTKEAKAPASAETQELAPPPPPPPPPPAPPAAELQPQPFRPRSSHRKSRGQSSDQRDASSSASAPPPPSGPKASKKARLVPSLPPSRQDLECDGYTTSDSFSHDNVMQVDWRVYQIKHRECSTNGQVTQYWHYVDKSDPGSEESMFEHQVLKDVIPGRRLNVKWGVYKEPIDFHLRFRELTEITYAPDSLNIIIGTKPVRGVSFRGDLRRFLKFMEGKGIRLIKTSYSYVDDAWANMESEVLPCASENED